MTAAIAVLGAVLVAVGAGLVYLPAGLVVGGVELICAAYVTAYVRRAEA